MMGAGYSPAVADKLLSAGSDAGGTGNVLSVFLLCVRGLVPKS
jgi:hypothetical protein